MLDNSEKEIVTQRLAERDKCRKDKLFLAQSLGYDFQPDVHGELFDQYIEFKEGQQYFAQSTTKNRMVLWSRGHYKTTSIVVEIIQTILNYPDVRILVMQGSLKTTRRLMQEIASHFIGSARSSRLTELFPEFCGIKKQLHLTAEGFTVPCRQKRQLQQATVTAASPRATKTGQHYDVGFFDDLIHDQNYRNQNLIQKAIEDFTMCQPLIDPGGYRYVTGTRYAFGDLYEIIAEQALRTSGTWRISIKTCWSDDGKHVRFPQRTLEDGRMIGFTRETLNQIKLDDPAVFSSQYLNQPIASGEQLFTEAMMLDAIIPEIETPALSPPLLFIDLASGDKTHNDDSVIFAARVDTLGRVYFVDCIGGQWPPAQLALHVLAMSLKHRPLRVMIERTASCAYFTEYLRLLCAQKGVQLPLDFMKVDNTKDAKAIRIASLQGLIKSRRIRFFPTLPAWGKILEQFTQFPRARYGHDDYPDTVALAIQNLAPSIMARGMEKTQHPFLAAIEQQATEEATRHLFEDQTLPPESCGSDFGA